MMFNRFMPANLSLDQANLVEKLMNRYLLGIFIGRSSGDILYTWQIDSSLRMDLISHFLAALSMFGEENVGKIKKIKIEGLNIEMSIITKEDLICASFFRPNMVKDYLEEEATRGLELFYRKFQKEIESGKSNRTFFERFDADMYQLIVDYMHRIGILDTSLPIESILPKIITFGD